MWLTPTSGPGVKGEPLTPRAGGRPSGAPPDGTTSYGLRAWRADDGGCAVAAALHEVTEHAMWAQVAKLMAEDASMRLACAASLLVHLTPTWLTVRPRWDG